MSVRRFLLAAVLVLVAAVAVALAGPAVTVVLTNGQQYSGSLVYRNNAVGLITDSGRQLSWPQNDVAVIEFSPGQPSEEELSQLESGGGSFMGGLFRGHQVAVALQNGEVITGSLSSISNDGNRVTITNASNQRDNFFANDIARLYLNPAAASNLYASAGMSSGAVGTSGQMGQYRPSAPFATLRVAAQQPWTQTSITVRPGERLVFQVSGRIHWGPGQENVVGPDGATTPTGSPDAYPVSTVGVGALIGRVANSQPFPIGSTTEPVVMPAGGQLILGVNDNYFGDNSGTFVVRVSRAGR